MHKNVTRNIERILEATSFKIAVVLPVTITIQIRRTKNVRHGWISKDELISNVLLWTPSHGRASVGRPARTYLQQLSKNTGCRLEDLPGAMDDRDERQERKSGKSVLAAQPDDDIM